MKAIYKYPLGIGFIHDIEIPLYDIVDAKIIDGVVNIYGFINSELDELFKYKFVIVPYAFNINKYVDDIENYTLINDIIMKINNKDSICYVYYKKV